jgi:hypothetical protein
LNRGKGKKTLNEWLSTKTAEERSALETRLQPYLLTTLAATDIPKAQPDGVDQGEEAEEQDALTEDAYRAFLVSRWPRLRGMALDGLGLDDSSAEADETSPGDGTLDAIHG